MTDLKPGLYKATVRGVAERIVMVTDGEMVHTAEPVCVRSINYREHFVSMLTNARPLVVLDLDDPRRTVADLAAAIDATGNSAVAHRLIDLKAEIEEQTKPPRIPEPDLWGVVEAGVKQHNVRLNWLRLEAAWIPEDRNEYDRAWADLIDPVLIREGV